MKKIYVVKIGETIFGAYATKEYAKKSVENIDLVQSMGHQYAIVEELEVLEGPNEEDIGRWKHPVKIDDN